MRTPAGKECKYFYGNYFRGTNKEECRLIGAEPSPHHWDSKLCRTCPVPDILLANSCEYMHLDAKVNTGFLSLFRKVKVSAFCSKKGGKVEDPMVGCGICHPLPSFIIGDQE
jgi:hypothetical protein